MAQINTGTVKVINASAAVQGTGTSWSGEVDVSDLFKVKDEDVIYQVGSITDNTNLTLSAPYTGTTRSGEQYQITRDFTPNLTLPEPHAGDIDWPAILRRALNLIDARINQSLLITSTPTFISVLLSNLTASNGVFTDGTKTLTSTGTLGVDQGGTGVSTLTTAYGLLAAGTTATGAIQTLAAGALTELLVGGGTGALPVWTTATGTGAPVRADSPTFTTLITTPVIYGSSAANGDITIEGTSNGTKATSYVILQPTSGNVGIGTTTPTQKLDVYGVNGEGGIRVRGTIPAGYVANSMILDNDTGVSRIISTGADASTLGNIAFINSGSDGTGYAEVMRIKNGNVGIGTTDLDGTPAIGRLTVKGSTNDGSTQVQVWRDSDEANVANLDTNGNFYVAADCSALTFTDRTPAYVGDALAEIAAIKVDANGEIDHATLPVFMQKTIRQTIDVFETEVLPVDAFETVMIEENEIEEIEEEVIDEKGQVITQIKKQPIVLSTVQVQQGFKIVDNQVVPNLVDEITYKKISKQVTRQRADVFFNKYSGKFYLRKQRLIETPGRNIGAAISMIQAAILQLKERLSLI